MEGIHRSNPRPRERERKKEKECVCERERGGIGRGRTKEQKALVNELPHSQSFESWLHSSRSVARERERESFNSKLPGNYTSVTVLS